MTNAPRPETDSHDPLAIAERILTACQLVEQGDETATAVWVCGLPRCRETYAAIREAERTYGLILAVQQGDDPTTVSLEVRQPDLPPAVADAPRRPRLVHVTAVWAAVVGALGRLVQLAGRAPS